MIASKLYLFLKNDVLNKSQGTIRPLLEPVLLKVYLQFLGLVEW